MTEPIQNKAEKHRPVILVIHPDESFVHGCQVLLEKHGFEMECSSDGTEGLQKVYRLIPDVILAGSATPELNGYQICRLIKNDPVMRRIPLIIIAHQDRKMDQFWAIKAGADDFLSEETLQTKLLKKISMVLEIYERMDIEEKKTLQISNEKNPFNIRTRLNQILDTSLVESRLMVEFRSLADLVHDPALLNYMLFSLLESIVEYDAAAIFYNDEDKGGRLLTVHLPEGHAQPSSQIEKMMADFFTRFEGNGLSPEQLEIQTSEVIGALDEGSQPAIYETAYIKEVRLDGKLLGAVALYSLQKVDYSKIFPIYLIEDEIRLLMKLRNLYSRAETMALTDSLTGLFNHRHFMGILLREFKTSQRYEQELSLAVIGIDNLKQINDEWGHACGDEILGQMARMLEAIFRSVDILARFGGKNLAALLPQTSPEQATIALKRFHAKVKETPFLFNEKPITVNVSGGLASIGENVSSASVLIHQAEQSLMLARNNGGDRIEISAS